MSFEQQMQELEAQKREHILRNARAKVEQERLKADKEEVKVQRYEVQLNTEMIKLEQDETTQLGEQKVLELKQVGLESVEADVNFARQKLALKQQRYDFEVQQLTSEIEQRIQDSYNTLDAIGGY